MKKEWLVKTLALGVVVLFVGVSFQPTIAVESVLNERESNYEDVDFEEAKKYLFETIIDIANNPEFKDLSKQYGNNLFTSSYDYKNLFSELRIEKPGFLGSMLFIKPKMTDEYLETIYNKGVELVDIIGEEESLKIVESFKMTNPGFFDDLKNVIMDDEELSSRISVLEKMNIDPKSDLEWDFPIICTILNYILGPFVFLIGITLYEIYQSTVQIIFRILLLPILMPTVYLMVIIKYILIVIFCNGTFP